MKKAWIALAAVALIALPAAAEARGKGQDVRNAARYCKQLRAQLGAETFRETFAGKRHAFGKCVKKRAHELRAARRAARRECSAEVESRAAFRRCVREKTAAETSDDRDGVVNAAKQCAAERDQDPAEFEQNYGTNHNKRNAFGKCVSKHASEAPAES